MCISSTTAQPGCATSPAKSARFAGVKLSANNGVCFIGYSFIGWSQNRNLVWSADPFPLPSCAQWPVGELPLRPYQAASGLLMPFLVRTSDSAYPARTLPVLPVLLPENLHHTVVPVQATSVLGSPVRTSNQQRR